MNPPVYYLVTIERHAGMAELLRQYEQRAMPIMQRHGGRFVYVFRPVQDTRAAPDEVHLLVFDSEQSFAAFRADPELQAMRHLRDAAVKRYRVLPLHAIALDAYLTHL